MKIFLSLLICVAALTHADSQSFNGYSAPQSRNGGGGGSSYAGNGGGNGGGGNGGYGGNGNGGNGGGNGEPASYNFQYDVNDEASGNNFGHQESRDGPRAEGTYYVQLPDSRIMTVEYYADETGYHPTITFEGEAQFPEDGSNGGSQYPQAQESRQPSNSYQQPQQQQSPPSQQYGQPFGK